MPLTRPYMKDNSMYVFIQPLHHEQDVTQSQFLSGVIMAWIQFSQV